VAVYCDNISSLTFFTSLTNFTLLSSSHDAVILHITPHKVYTLVRESGNHRLLKTTWKRLTVDKSSILV